MCCPLANVAWWCSSGVVILWISHGHGNFALPCTKVFALHIPPKKSICSPIYLKCARKSIIWAASWRSSPVQVKCGDVCASSPLHLLLLLHSQSNGRSRLVVSEEILYFGSLSLSAVPPKLHFGPPLPPPLSVPLSESCRLWSKLEL